MGEVDIFRKVGLTPVFFGRTLVGPRMPSLMYMLVHENMAGREKSWDAFRTSPDWKKGETPGFSDAEIVSNITTVFLRPAAYSRDLGVLEPLLQLAARTGGQLPETADADPPHTPRDARVRRGLSQRCCGWNHF